MINYVHWNKKIHYLPYFLRFLWLFSGNFIQFREDIWLFFKKYIKNIKKIAIYVEKILYVMI